jgi:hypothetical protein
MTCHERFVVSAIFLVLVAGLCLGDGSLALASERSRAQPMLLSDKQLDRITAGGVTLRVDLSAEAQGPTAVASTTGLIQSADTTVLLVRIDAGGAAGPTPHFLGQAPATVYLAGGQAIASGDATSNCSANVEASGDFAFLTGVSLKTSTAGPPTPTLTCGCAAFGITLGRN